MPILYVVMSATAKGTCLRKGIVNGGSGNLDPETMAYEQEKQIINCFLDYASAKAVETYAGRNRKTGIIGLEVPDQCIFPKRITVSGRRGSKAQTAVMLGQEYGVFNYGSTFNMNGKQYTYVILYKVSDIQRIFDPNKHHVNVVRKGPDSPVRRAPSMQCQKEPPKKEPPKKEMPRPVMGPSEACVDEGGGNGNWWWLLLLAALALGFLLGLAWSGFADRHPIASSGAQMTALSAVLLGIIYSFSSKKS